MERALVRVTLERALQGRDEERVRDQTWIANAITRGVTAGIARAFP